MLHNIYTLYAVRQSASVISSVNAFRGPIDPKSTRATKNNSLNNNEQKCAGLRGTNLYTPILLQFLNYIIPIS